MQLMLMLTATSIMEVTGDEDDSDGDFGDDYSFDDCFDNDKLMTC
mgnify:CR=1 FL=1